MDYKLNPDAKEFVPVHSPTLETFPTSTTPLSPNAPNFEPTTADVVANAVLSGDLFGSVSFESEPQKFDFNGDLNPFGLNSAPIEPEQLASPSFGMAETPSYAILENIGVQETPLATPQIPDALPWSANALEQLQDPMQFIEEQFKEPSPIKEDLNLMAAVLEEVPQSPIKEVAVPDFIPEEPLSPFKEDVPMSPVLDDLPVSPIKFEAPTAPFQDDLPVSPIKFEAPTAPFQEQLLASPVNEDVISPSSPVVELQQEAHVFAEHFSPEPQQPDLIESLPSQPFVVLDDIVPVEKMIEEESVVLLPETKVEEEAPKPVEPLVEAPAILKNEAPEEPKVKRKLYRRKSKKIKRNF